MVAAGVFAALHQVVELHEERLALPGADDLHAVPQLRGEGQDLPESVAGLHPGQDGSGAGIVEAEQVRLPPQQYADLSAGLPVGADCFPRCKPGPPHVEAADHGLDLAAGNALEQGQLSVFHAVSLSVPSDIW